MGQETDYNDNLARSLDSIKGVIRGRGVATVKIPAGVCICKRHYTHILCLNCGHLMFGRVRYRCPKHTKVTFLIDITNCPKCRCYEYMLHEFDIKKD